MFLSCGMEWLGGDLVVDVVIAMYDMGQERSGGWYGWCIARCEWDMAWYLVLNW